MKSTTVLHRLRENEYLDGDPPIFSCACGFTGPRADVDRHVADMAEANDAALRGDPPLRAIHITNLNHELSLAAIAWAKGDDAADDYAARLDQRSLELHEAEATLDEKDPKRVELDRLHEAADEDYTHACEREDRLLEHMKAVAKRLTRELERLS